MLNAKLTLKCCPEKRCYVPAVHVFVWRLACGVVPAWKNYHLVIERMPLELLHHVAGEFRQEGKVIFCVHDERFLRRARKLREIRHRTNGTPEQPQAL